MPKKSSCCGADLLSGVQCECCGADERKFEVLTPEENEEIINEKINLEISTGDNQ